MKKLNKIDDAILECYIRLYKNSIPSADFIELMNNAEINEKGEKIINYMNYEIEQDKLNNIIQDIIKEFKVPKYFIEKFKTTIYLGCSPKSKNIKKQ